MTVCACCRTEFAPCGRGRPPRFCSDRCRFRWHDRRRTLRRRLVVLDRLSRVTPEPYASGYARRAEVTCEELSRLRSGTAETARAGC